MGSRLPLKYHIAIHSCNTLPPGWLPKAKKSRPSEHQKHQSRQFSMKHSSALTLQVLPDFIYMEYDHQTSTHNIFLNLPTLWWICWLYNLNIPDLQTPCYSTNNGWFSAAQKIESPTSIISLVPVKMSSSLGCSLIFSRLKEVSQVFISYLPSPAPFIPLSNWHTYLWNISPMGMWPSKWRMSLPFFSPLSSLLGKKSQVMDTIGNFYPALYIII